ncbi:hypothetical protein EJ110_NYTH25032 [Nymphaea thermarum]|nr:hypothetical protein EJ110_NYTH25032 [Nymphaea thermarum]
MRLAVTKQRRVEAAEVGGKVAKALSFALGKRFAVAKLTASLSARAKLRPRLLVAFGFSSTTRFYHFCEREPSGFQALAKGERKRNSARQTDQGSCSWPPWFADAYSHSTLRLWATGVAAHYVCLVSYPPFPSHLLVLLLTVAS